MCIRDRMNIINGDRIHEKFDKNVLADFTLDRERLDFVKQFDLVYSEKWSRIGRYIKDIKNGNNIMIHDFSKRLADPGNEEILQMCIRDRPWGGGEDKVCGCRLNPSLISEVLPLSLIHI